MNPERTTLIADIGRTLDTYNRSRPWAPMIIFSDDLARVMDRGIRALLDAPAIEQTMAVMRALHERYPALFGASASGLTRHGVYRRTAPKRSLPGTRHAGRRH